MNQKGFSLIEVVLSLAIISIIVVPFMQIFITSTSTNNLSKREIQATFLAQKYMEEAKANIKTDDLLNTDEFTYIPDGEYYLKEESNMDFNIRLEYRNQLFPKSGAEIVDGDITLYEADLNIYFQPSSSTTEMNIPGYSKNYYNENKIFEFILTPKDDDSIDFYIKDTSEFPDSSIVFNINDFNDPTGESIVIQSNVSENENEIHSIGFLIKNNTDRTLHFYKTDDPYNKLKISVETGEVVIISNLNSDPDSSTLNLEDLYEVTIIVSHEGKVYEKIVSQIRK